MERFKRLGGSVLNHLARLDQIFSNDDSKIILERIKYPRNFYPLMLYGSWARDGLLLGEERTFLIQASKWSEICVIVNSSKIDPWLIDNEFSYIHRRNEGRDLAGLRDAMSIVKLSKEIRDVFWLNSSCIWNSDSLKKILDDYTFEENQVYAMTESFQGGYHLQSYFYLFKKSFIEHYIQENLQLPFLNFKTKRATVYFGEKKFHSWLESHNINYGVIFPASEIDQVMSKTTNPSTTHWQKLLKLGAPFIKRNPKKSFHLRQQHATMLWNQNS